LIYFRSSLTRAAGGRLAHLARRGQTLADVLAGKRPPRARVVGVEKCATALDVLERETIFRARVCGSDLCLVEQLYRAPSTASVVARALLCFRPAMVCARDLMQHEPISIPSRTPFLEILRLFVVGQIGGAPVVDDRGTVLGVLSVTDLLRVVDQVCDEDIDPEPAREGDRVRVESSEEELPERFGALTAIDVVTPDVVWVSPETPIARVAHLMRTEGIHRVLVGVDGRLAGILTAFDLLKAIEG